ncbi:transcriptional regulator, TetR family [Streptoalloteichus tenebrarius]|uniref:Transcriptional regulator, TetR family n=1 Tax=Streptoalloteichus tenebrarius (strain ATCC 17920 / DSM 40477 / JCM 4838 / CBS 697.72 / NBRC 16177 / NCIMB 11028 / NRRL B-12390 / A12253. 1 / ISP 5477) TaxID=1933 RepID=A0ABT1I242_STRSD|nr:transcriptional regulator, TetR family [Streptoalloteichus tenebrarius]
MWLRPERRVRDRRLSRERIVRVVVEVLDAEGHDGLSMRRVAERLGVTPGSLYWHVATKDEMVELALDAVLGEVDIAAAERMADWRQALLTVAQAHRAVMLRHRWMIPLLSTRRTLGPNALRAAEHTLRVLSRAGFDEDMLDAALSALNQLVVGAVVFESAWREGAEAAGRADDHQREEAAEFARRIGERHPLLAAARFATDPPDREDVWADRFAFGFGCLLNGLEAYRSAPETR